jgi:hypothetical protein
VYWYAVYTSMQTSVTSRDEITVKVNANELALINYALSYFGFNASTKNFPAGDLEDAKLLGDQLFHVYTVVADDQAEVA